MSMFPQRMGILNVGQKIEEQAEFENIYKNGIVCYGYSTESVCYDGNVVCGLCVSSLFFVCHF